MATAEEILAQAAENGVGSTDTKSYLTVDLYSRVISVPPIIKNIGVESDDEVTRLYFKMPRYYNDIDLSRFVIRINYTNANNDGDVYGVDDVKVIDDEITFSWLVGRYAVSKQGNVSFIVCMVEVDEFGYITREFNTTVCSLPVLKGLETVESLKEEEKDAMQAIAKEAARAAREEFGGGGGNIAARIGYVTLTSVGWQGDSSPYSQAVEVEGVTPYSQVDLTPNVEQLSIFYNKDLTFVTENDNGTVTVYAIGQKPENDYTIQVTITEVVI